MVQKKHLIKTETLGGPEEGRAARPRRFWKEEMWPSEAAEVRGNMDEEAGLGRGKEAWALRTAACGMWASDAAPKSTSCHQVQTGTMSGLGV